MKHSILYVIFLCFAGAVAQDADKAKQKAIKKANSFVYEANALASSDDFVSAEMEYRKALSEQPEIVAGAYNLGHAYYNEGNFEEALYRNQQAITNATSKSDKHIAFHNIGNILMQNEKCTEAVEAFKNALRNEPSDNESRYNLALAQECVKNQPPPPPEEEDDKDDKDKDKKEDENKEENKDDGENKENDNNEGDQDQKDGDNDNEDDGKPNDEKDDKGDGNDDKEEQQKPQQQPGQMSPQQIKNLLEAMNNQEQKVQEKMNAQKAKGVKVETEKDW